MSHDNFFNLKDTSSIIFPDNSICSLKLLMELAALVYGFREMAFS